VTIESLAELPLTVLPFHLGHGLPLSKPNLGVAKLPDDLLRRELLSARHLSPSLGLHLPEILSLKVATLKGGRSGGP